MDSIRPLLVLAGALISFLGCALILGEASGEIDWRRSILTVCVVWGVLIWLITELLSLLGLLTFSGVAISWIIGLIFSVAVCVRMARIQIRSLPRLLLEGLHFSNPFDSYLSKSLGVGLALILLVLSLVALLAAPNTWDSQTYHLPRIMHWQQNQDVNFYPTHILRQLHSAPWAEMAILHLHILAGSDRLANFIQLFAMIAALIGVSWIAKHLGGDRNVQLFSSLAAATLPMGILQSTSTQNDYAAAFWLVCFVSFALDQSRSQTFTSYLLAGASLGLAILTKPTAWVFAASFAFWIGLRLLKKLKGEVWKPAVTIASLVLLINSGYFSRNVRLYGNPLGPLEEAASGVAFRYTNDVFTLRSLASNVLRNVGLQLSTPFEGVNDRLTGIIVRFHSLLGIDPSDPGSTWPGSTFSVGDWSRHEDEASNPWHFALIILSLLLLLRWRDRQAGLYALCLIAGFLLFSLLFKWQPWHNRLLLPLFVLAMPLAVVVLSHFGRPRLLQATLVGFVLLAVPFVLANKSRPVLGQDNIFTQDRIQQYFKNQPWLEASYRNAIQRIPAECSRLGLIMNTDSWEYPLWVLSQASNRRLTIEHVRVENGSSRYARQDFIPCAIIVDSQNPAEQITLNGVMYRKKYQKSPLSVFVP